MALDLDAFSITRTISSNSRIFASIKAELVKAEGAFVAKLRSLLTKEVKSKASSLSDLLEIRKCLGAQTFDLLISGMKDAEIKAIIGKLDKHHPDQKSASAEWRRRHLRSLVEGSIQPSLPQPKKKSPGRSAKATQRKKSDMDYLEDESAGAVRKR
jgi:hypothetical protein